MKEVELAEVIVILYKLSIASVFMSKQFRFKMNVDSAILFMEEVCNHNTKYLGRLFKLFSEKTNPKYLDGVCHLIATVK